MYTLAVFTSLCFDHHIRDLIKLLVIGVNFFLFLIPQQVRLLKGFEKVWFQGLIAVRIVQLNKSDVLHLNLGAVQDMQTNSGLFN